MIELSRGPLLPTGMYAVYRAYYLPSVHVPALGGAGEVDKARRIFELMKAHPHQGREAMVWDKKLAECARWRTRSQALNGWTGHVWRELGPNYYAEAFDYKLPSWYSQEDDANNIESLAHNGDGSVEGVWEGWLNSPAHATHILGLNDFFAGQTQVGVGYYADSNSDKKFYWAVLSAHPEGA